MSGEADPVAGAQPAEQVPPGVVPDESQAEAPPRAQQPLEAEQSLEAAAVEGPDPESLELVSLERVAEELRALGIDVVAAPGVEGGMELQGNGLASAAFLNGRRYTLHPPCAPAAQHEAGDA